MPTRAKPPLAGPLGAARSRRSRGARGATFPKRLLTLARTARRASSPVAASAGPRKRTPWSAPHETTACASCVVAHTERERCPVCCFCCPTSHNSAPLLTAILFPLYSMSSYTYRLPATFQCDYRRLMNCCCSGNVRLVNVRRHPHPAFSTMRKPAPCIELQVRCVRDICLLFFAHRFFLSLLTNLVPLHFHS